MISSIRGVTPGTWAAASAFTRCMASSSAQVPGVTPRMEEIIPEIAPLLSLLLYLCSEAADYGKGPRPQNPHPVKTAKGPRLFPSQRPRVWEVGARLGAALRRAYAEASEKADAAADRAHPRPHIRRAHWHAYRVGPGRQEVRLHWLPPIPVNVEDFSDLPTVVRPVEPDSSPN